MAAAVATAVATTGVARAEAKGAAEAVEDSKRREYNSMTSTIPH